MVRRTLLAYSLIGKILFASQTGGLVILPQRHQGTKKRVCFAKEKQFLPGSKEDGRRTFPT